MGNRLVTIDMVRKVEVLCSFFWGDGFHLTQSGLHWGLPPCQVSSWSIQPFGHNTPLQTDRTGETDRQWSDSIGWIVLQMVTHNISTAATSLNAPYILKKSTNHTHSRSQYFIHKQMSNHIIT